MRFKCSIRQVLVFLKTLLADRIERKTNSFFAIKQLNKKHDRET